MSAADALPPHLPRLAPIDTYGGGGFRFAGMSHRGSLVCVPSGIYAWQAPVPAEIGPEALERVFAEAAGIEVFLLGMGKLPLPMPAALRAALGDAGIVADAMSTGAAVRTFNVLLGDGRPVAAALIAVD